MENKLTPELIEKAKAAKSAEELVTLAKENNVELTTEEASAYFGQLNQKSGELSDEELDNVAGGGCYRANGNLSVSSLYSCEHWKCSKCGGTEEHEHLISHMDGNSLSAHSMLYKKQCSCCGWATSASTICTNPLNNKNNK